MQIVSQQTVLTKEQIDILYRNLYPVIFATIAAALIIIWILHDVISPAALSAWLGAAVLIIFARIYIGFLYQRSDHKKNENLIKWQRLFLVGVILSGLWWGISGWYFLSISPMQIKIMLVLVYGGLLAGSTLAYCYLPMAYYLFMGLSITPTIIFLLFGSRSEVQMSLFLCAYTFFLCLFYHRLVNELSRAMQLESKVESLETELELERRDISVQHHRYASIEDKYQQLVENASDLIFRTNEKGDYIYVNQECVNVTGFTQDELLQKNYLDLVHPGHRQRVKRSMLRLYASRQKAVTNIDFPIVTVGGDTRWVSQTTQLIKLDNEHKYEFQGIARDISQEKNRSELLEQAREKEAQALTIKNDFINNISHELRTPLHVISGSINLLEESGLSEFQDSQLKILTASSNQMLALINDILDLSRIEKNQIEFVNAPFSTRDLINEIMLTFEQLAKEKGILLSYSVDKRIPETMIGDYYRLLQILVNLVSNAIKYSREGKVIVSLSLESSDASEIKVLFSVSDTGIGIRAHELDKIFDKFQQTRHGAKFTRAGTGLGLAIVKSLVELQGGALSVNSVVNKGSTFSFNLTFKTVNEAINDDALSDSGTYAVLTDGIDGRSARILIADDNDMVKAVVVSQLRQFWGEKIIIDSVDNGHAVLEQVEENNYDLILMDLQMPIMDGTTATKTIRNMSGPNKNTTIMALSAASIPIDELKGFGFDDSLPKPFTKDDLIKRISYWFQQCNENKIKDTID